MLGVIQSNKDIFKCSIKKINKLNTNLEGKINLIVNKTRKGFIMLINKSNKIKSHLV